MVASEHLSSAALTASRARKWVNPRERKNAQYYSRGLLEKRKARMTGGDARVLSGQAPRAAKHRSDRHWARRGEEGWSGMEAGVNRRERDY